ncbi:MAG TPA: helix-turn-helix domain-containing protein [Rubrobacter sp.]|jgi:excisionase family DNA binding protein|nr:helix-turn-helix domain-containing protein [Rubrobacter sp.]
MRERVYRGGFMGGLRGEGEGRYREDLVLLSADEVAKRLGVDRANVWRWGREGRITCLKIGKLWRVRRESLEALLEEPGDSGVPRSPG